MLWAITFHDASLGYVEVGTGLLYTQTGAAVTGATSYTTTDTAPAQPAWYVPTPAPVVPPAPEDWRVTEYALMRRMTAAERVAIRTAAQSAPALADFMALMQAAAWVDLSDPETVAGVQALGAAGLLTPDRVTAILTTPPTDNERPAHA